MVSESSRRMLSCMRHPPRRTLRFHLPAMASNIDLARTLEHLASQFERGLPMLFVGAGFSVAATNVSRTTTIPSVEDLKKALWTLCFLGENIVHLQAFR